MNFNDILYYSQHRSSSPPRRDPEIEALYRHALEQKNYGIELYDKLFPSTDVDWTVTLNKYPYHFVDDTVHYIIWYRGVVRYEDFKDTLDELGAVHFENEPSEKSVPTIDHIHVFIHSDEAYRLHVSLGD